jgi:carboxypeptidase Taq
MEKEYTELRQRFREIADLGHVAALLNWDQSTYMPPGGAEARGRQTALVATLRHQRLADEQTGYLLEKLAPWAAQQPPESDEAAFVRLAQRAFDRAVRIPASLVERAYAHFSKGYQVWTAARPDNDFSAVLPILEETLEISRLEADCFPGYDHIADPLIDVADYGMKANDIRRIFAELRRDLVPLVEAVCARPEVDDAILRQAYDVSSQREFGERVIRDFGYDFERGRQDLTHHPFMTKFSLGDVRITTRFNDRFLADGLFSTLHEAGHAMYEQGIRREFEASPLGIGTSSGVHESQSRLWENIVGRSRPFWEHYFPILQGAFPGQLANASLDDFYRAVNKVVRSLIRVDADELTYNLHVMIRFDLELEMLEGRLAIKDLPEAWHARYEADLGMRAPDDRDGVLQDVHWYAGPIGGAFQGYALGNILGGLFYAQALRAHPQIPDEIGRGQFATLHDWMRTNIYQHGSKFTAAELIARISGNGLSIQPYLDYLSRKYAQIYSL